ncbi:MAG: hypothetical protein WC325_00260 [Candidatus Bathyarchaeia archaeon]|jgi:hypothetical protein
MTIIMDDAGSGDLLYGVVIGAYHDSGNAFKYEIIDVKYFKSEFFSQKAYLKQCTKIVTKLLDQLKPAPEEEIHMCRGYIFDDAFEVAKKKYGEERVKRIKVEGEAQDLIETAYLDEIRNLGYEPLENRETQMARSFFHMMDWLKENPSMMKYAKTGWPRLQRYKMFRTKQ